MQSPAKHDLQTAAAEADGALAVDTELSILRGVFKMLPAGVTVQDEQGRFLLVNDVAAEQLGIAVEGAGAPDSKELVAVGTPITERPPHRTVRARFGHTA